MLHELLQEEMQKLTEIVEKKHDYIKLQFELEEKIARLKCEIDDISRQMDEAFEQMKTMNAERTAHPLKSFIGGIRKQIQNNMEVRNQLEKAYKEKKAEYQREETVANPQIRENQEQLQCIEDAEHQLELMNSDQNYAIKKLIKTNPELLENEEFVLDLLNISVEFIALDKTDSEKVYSKFLSKASKTLEEFKMQMEKKGDKDFQHFIQGELEDINYCLEELKNPQVVSDDKYKIPHKFLYEALRRMTLKQHEEMQEIRMAESIAGICSKYKEFDGKCDYTSGKKMEELYMDEKTDLYYHVIWGQFSPDTEIRTIKGIQREGLYLRGNYCCHMNRTTVSQTQLDGHFFGFLGATRNANAMILNIPKNEHIILGNNTSENDNMYILPEYVVGRIKQNGEGEIEFIENPIPVSERTVYEHKYIGVKTNDLDGKISPIAAVKNALSQGTTIDETMQAATIGVEISKDKTYNRRGGVTKDD